MLRTAKHVICVHHTTVCIYDPHAKLLARIEPWAGRAGGRLCAALDSQTDQLIVAFDMTVQFYSLSELGKRKIKPAAGSSSSSAMTLKPDREFSLELPERRSIGEITMSDDGRKLLATFCYYALVISARSGSILHTLTEKENSYVTKELSGAWLHRSGVLMAMSSTSRSLCMYHFF